MTTWDGAVVVSHLQLNQALLEIRLWHLVGNCSFSHFTDGNVPFSPEHWVATCDLPFLTDLRRHIINTGSQATARHLEQQEVGSSSSFVHLVWNVRVTGCAGAMQHDPSRSSSVTSFLRWFFSPRVGTGVVKHVHVHVHGPV